MDEDIPALLRQAPEQDLLSQWPLDLVLDQTGHRTGTHGDVVALVRQPGFGRIIHMQYHMLFVQLRLQLRQELVHHMGDGVLLQVTELNNAVQTIAELRREGLADDFHTIGAVVLLAEADRPAGHTFSPGVGGHHQDYMAEIRFSAIVIGQRTVVHDLQKQVEDFRMGLLNFIQQQHTMGVLGDRLSQQAALVITDIARGRPNES